VESCYSIIILLIYNYFNIWICTFWSKLVPLPFKRLECCMICWYVFISIFLYRINFWKSAATVFYWCKNSCGYVYIIHFFILSRKKSLWQKLSRFYCYRSKFQLSINNISNRINIWDVCLFYIIDLKLSIFFADYSSVF
jgi:hypothetical protein